MTPDPAEEQRRDEDELLQEAGGHERVEQGDDEVERHGTRSRPSSPSVRPVTDGSGTETKSR